MAIVAASLLAYFCATSLDYFFRRARTVLSSSTNLYPTILRLPRTFYCSISSEVPFDMSAFRSSRLAIPNSRSSFFSFLTYNFLGPFFILLHTRGLVFILLRTRGLFCAGIQNHPGANAVLTTHSANDSNAPSLPGKPNRGTERGISVLMYTRATPRETRMVCAS